MIPLALVQIASAAQLALQLDTTEVQEGQAVGLELVVVDTDPRGAPDLTVPDGLSATAQGSSKQFISVNFQKMVATTYSYSLMALHAGNYTIGPVEMSTSAGTLHSNVVHLSVAPRGDSATDTLIGEIGAKTAWVGQILVYHARFQTAERLVHAQWSAPSAPGFTAEPSAQPQTPEYQLVQDGRPLAVRELYYPIRASAPGNWKVPGAVLQGQFAVTQRRQRRPAGGFFDEFGAFGNVRAEVYSAEALPLEVRPVPTEGRPADATPLVGHFSVSAQASAPELKVGDTVTVEVKVEGDGDLAGFALPPLEGTAFKVYDDQPTVSAEIAEGKYHATATFKRAIVPTQPGDIEVPAVTLSYFDPTTSGWARASTEPIHLTVHEGESTTAKVITSPGDAAPKGVDALGEDILPVRTDARLSPPWPPALALTLLAPGAALLAFQGLGALRRRPARAVERRLDFGDLPSDPEGRLAGLEQIFRERVGARLGVPPAGLRREDLAGLGAGSEEAEAIYRELERARYGGAPGALPEARIRTFVEGLGAKA